MKKYLLTMALVSMSTSTIAAEVFTANELCNEFRRNNGKVAEVKYKNKRIIVSGKIVKIEPGYNYWRLRLKCYRKVSKSRLKGVKLKVNKSESNQLKKLAGDQKNSSMSGWYGKLNQGENIKFSCKYETFNRVGVYLKDCRIY